MKNHQPQKDTILLTKCAHIFHSEGTQPSQTKVAILSGINLVHLKVTRARHNANGNAPSRMDHHQSVKEVSPAWTSLAPGTTQHHAQILPRIAWTDVKQETIAQSCITKKRQANAGLANTMPVDACHNQETMSTCTLKSDQQSQS
jgi:hypothetical protein